MSASNPVQLAALTAICDTFIASEHRENDPNGYWQRKASDLQVPERILALLSKVKQEDQDDFAQLLALLSSPLLGLTWGGPFKPAHQLSAAQREKMLKKWANSRLGLLRKAYSTLRKATMFLYFGDVPDGMDGNPNHAAIGYTLPDLPPIPDAAPLLVAQPDKPTTVDCEILVIGSGSGGGVVAGLLAQAGHDVLVVEKGPYDLRQAHTMQEFPMLHRHFEAGALLASKSGSVSVMAGSTWGGGSAINWAGALRTPDEVLEEWANAYHNPHFLQPAYQKGFDYIEQRNHVNTVIPHNAQNTTLMEAAQKLGWDTRPIPMNIRLPEGTTPDDAYWKAIGFSCLNDAHGLKQGVQETFLRDAAQNGARFMANTAIEQIVVKNGVATGAQGYALTPAGSRVAVQIRAKKVVVSAGALHTPVLLMKSGIVHPQLGRNLFLHPVVPTVAMHERDIYPWQGPMMSVIVKAFERVTGNWGFRIECPPVHPGLGAFAMSWENSASAKSDLLNLKNMVVHICLVRDKFGGRVKVGKKSGQPVIEYDVHPFDLNHLILSMQRSAEAHVASGAKRVSILHNTPLHYFPGGPQAGSLTEFQNAIARKPWGANHAGVFSAHQMGTCRMGGNRDCPVQPDGQVRGIRQLYVADASLFPSASGSNPMLSVQALAYHVAQTLI